MDRLLLKSHSKSLQRLPTHRQSGLPWGNVASYSKGSEYLPSRLSTIHYSHECPWCQLRDFSQVKGPLAQKRNSPLHKAPKRPCHTNCRSFRFWSKVPHFIASKPRGYNTKMLWRDSGVPYRPNTNGNLVLPQISHYTCMHVCLKICTFK